jgi:hypothetical protein
VITTAADGFKEVRPPLSDADIESLKSGDRVRITGVIYTARDAAHGRLLPPHGRGPAPAHRRQRADHLLHGTVSRAPRPRGGLHRSHHGRAHGQVHSEAPGAGAQGDDRQGRALPAREGRALRAQGRLLRSYRGRGRRALRLREEARSRGLRKILARRRFDGSRWKASRPWSSTIVTAAISTWTA